jgi:hypothetical protein
MLKYSQRTKLYKLDSRENVSMYSKKNLKEHLHSFGLGFVNLSWVLVAKTISLYWCYLVLSDSDCKA